MLDNQDKEKIKIWVGEITQALLNHPSYSEMNTEAVQLIYKLCDSTNQAINDLLNEVNKNAN